MPTSRATGPRSPRSTTTPSGACSSGGWRSSTRLPAPPRGSRALASFAAMVVAIDGPAGAGKSTVARALAAELGFTYLDSGAMYRCVALAARGRPEQAPDIARAVEIELGDGRVLLDGRDVTAAIRAPEVSELASRVAADPGVRAALVDKQRALLARGDFVAEGRDIGTVVA